jgi:hypothetical protein
LSEYQLLIREPIYAIVPEPFDLLCRHQFSLANHLGSHRASHRN